MTTRGCSGGAIRILVIGNHACANRGDAAILRGLLWALQQKLPGADVTVTSRFPASSAHILGRTVEPDLGEGLIAKVRPARLRRLLERLLPHGLGAATHPRLGWLAAILPAGVRAAVERIRRFDAVIQVGGSYFVDHYGSRQYTTPFLSILARRPLLLLGHSMGPFRTGPQRRLARRLLDAAAVTALREPTSLRLMREAGISTEGLVAGADTAWLVPVPARVEPSRTPNARQNGFTIGFSLRDLAPFDADLQLSQPAYEAAFARLADALIADGHEIVALSTTTGLDSYHRDDRIPALRVRSMLGRPEGFRIVMDELNDVEIGERLLACDLVVATRLHCAIIAMNFGVPAIALNYEHKSEGVLRQLGLDRLALPLSALSDGTLHRTIISTLADLPAVRSETAVAVGRERERAGAMIDAALAVLGGRR